MGVKLQEEEIEGKTMASLLLLLPCGGTKGGKMNHRRRTSDRLFECKTCNRRFPTFQALGGHRTSHKRSRAGGERLELVQSKKMKPKVHGCPICGLEFPMGQALGGHMRRHKPPPAAGVQSEKKDGAEGKVMMLDLNSPPLDGGVEFTNLGLGGGFLKEITLFDFLGCSATASAS